MNKNEQSRNAFSYFGSVTLSNISRLGTNSTRPLDLGARRVESGSVKPQLPGGCGDLMTTEAVWESETSAVSNQNKWEQERP